MILGKSATKTHVILKDVREWFSVSKMIEKTFKMIHGRFAITCIKRIKIFKISDIVG